MCCYELDLPPCRPTCHPSCCCCRCRCRCGPAATTPATCPTAAAHLPRPRPRPRSPRPRPLQREQHVGCTTCQQVAGAAAAAARRPGSAAGVGSAETQCMRPPSADQSMLVLLGRLDRQEGELALRSHPKPRPKPPLPPPTPTPPPPASGPGTGAASPMVSAGGGVRGKEGLWSPWRAKEAAAGVQEAAEGEAGTQAGLRSSAYEEESRRRGMGRPGFSFKPGPSESNVEGLFALRSGRSAKPMWRRRAAQRRCGPLLRAIHKQLTALPLWENCSAGCSTLGIKQ